MKNDHLSSKWHSSDSISLAQEILKRLRNAESLAGLGLGEHEGRIDLRGFVAPPVDVQSLPSFQGIGLQKVTNRQMFENVHFERLDFSGADLSHFVFMKSKITNCRFDNANCTNWKLWCSDITATSFVGADLRAAVLGPWHEGRGNVYQTVDFSRADMREALSSAGIYTDCDFSYAKLVRLGFDSSSFVRCRFAGELREVIFYDRGVVVKNRPDSNPMEDIDFSEAKLRWCEFRRLNLDRVRLPQDSDHLIIQNYACVLQKALEKLNGIETQAGKGLKAVLANCVRWLGDSPKIGVFNRRDFAEMWGEDGAQFCVDLLRSAQAACVRPN